MLTATGTVYLPSVHYAPTPSSKDEWPFLLRSSARECLHILKLQISKSHLNVVMHLGLIWGPEAMARDIARRLTDILSGGLGSEKPHPFTDKASKPYEQRKEVFCPFPFTRGAGSHGQEDPSLQKLHGSREGEFLSSPRIQETSYTRLRYLVSASVWGEKPLPAPLGFLQAGILLPMGLLLPAGNQNAMPYLMEEKLVPRSRVRRVCCCFGLTLKCSRRGRCGNWCLELSEGHLQSLSQAWPTLEAMGDHQHSPHFSRSMHYAGGMEEGRQQNAGSEPDY